MKRFFIFLVCIAAFTSARAQIQTATKQPFAGLQTNWQNGSDRRDSATISGKYFVPSLLIDVNYTHSFNNPNDNTVVGSTALARNNEVQVSALHFGGDFLYGNARARVMLQLGDRSQVIPRNDLSPYRGQYRLADVYRYLSEAYAGYHFNKWYGINVDAGLFLSYIGLNSYYQAENWEYQASFTSDNTPWFFNGVRVQIFPTRFLKIEPWLINGWQSYGRFNRQPGVGANITYMPTDHLKMLTNDYYGADAAGIPNRKRFHSDNSFLVRYFNEPASVHISRAALSVTADAGFEKGGGVGGFSGGSAGPKQYFLSAMVYNRIWFCKNRAAFTIGGGVMKNPGRYLVLAPGGQASPLPDPANPTQTEGKFPFTENPGDPFSGWDASAGLEYFFNAALSVKTEFVHRATNIPYFAGAGGVTSPTGYSFTPLPADWRPDLVKSENRVVFALLFRL